MTTLTRNAFRDLVQSHRSDENDVTAHIIDREYEVILRAYDGEQQRHYHTISHIHTMWAAWVDHYTTSVAQSIDSDYSDKVVRLAILFHDIVYDPLADHGENERRSIEQWIRFAQSLRLDKQLVDDVRLLIEATISHKLPDPPYPDALPEFLDLDLLSSREEYAEYAAQIRDEYAHYSKEAYIIGRTTVLEHLKEGNAIYFTEYWRKQRQHTALANIDWELGQLSAGNVADAVS